MGEPRVRTGALAVPETFAAEALRCTGLGDLRSRLRHAITCREVACELRYLPADFPWEHIVELYRRRGESLDGSERARARHG